MEKKRTFFQKLVTFIFGETIKIQHPFFGELVDAGDYYEGRIFFVPISQPIEFGLDKTTPELEKKQIAFFLDLAANYSSLISAISPSIERRVAEWLLDYQIQDFEKEFILEHLDIPNFREKNPIWGVTFFADNNLQHWCILEMKGMEVMGIMIDG